MSRRAIIALLLLVLVPATARASLEGSTNPHGVLRWECDACHTPRSWTALRDSLGFSHDQTNFPLRGAHRGATCTGCHKSRIFTEARHQCADCHDDTHRGQLGTDCQSCHVTHSWLDREAVFDVHAEQGFALTGVHAVADCDACHLDVQPREFVGTSTDCRDCHQSDFAATVDPDHATAGFSGACESCHGRSADTWAGALFDHGATFPLTGGHAGPSCESCHASQYTGTSTVCVSCHEPDYQATADPNHVAGNFDQDCARCHTIAAWGPAEFDHALARFALTGAHVDVDCASCHTSGYTGTASECSACHETNFLSASEPNHLGAGFPQTCEVCHTTAAWAPSHIDHNLTSFALTGAHFGVDCASCHATGYTGTATACFTCHEAAYVGVADPDHFGSGFDHDCTGCHTTTAWLPASFDHNLTGFPLVGAHAAADCNSCHVSGYTGTLTECFACHEADYMGTVDPDHVGSAFPTGCEVCHTTTAWQPSEIDHNLTSFPLTGAHMAVDCAMCHATGYTGTPAICFACHETDYAGVADPDHFGSGFDHDCTVCHTTTAWQPASFDHNLTGFPLAGAHAAADCNSCHANGYTGTPMQCFACHETDYSGAVDPDHVAAAFPTGCEVCHTVEAWAPSHIQHDVTGFPLTGAHVGVDCVQCHATGYTGTSSVCFACHESDYTAVVDPNHVLSAFSQDCAGCHTTSGWLPAEYNHNLSAFVLTGAHLAVDCATCHTQGYTGTSQECFACHEDDYLGVLDPNHALNNFDHDCSLCHNTNVWTPSEFSHDQTAFPLTGAHTAVACVSCHGAGYVGTPADCFACHETDYVGVVDPNHVVNAFGQNCTVCHNTTAWIPADYNHNHTAFPLTGAHAAVDCISCHANGYAGTPNTCFACHETDYVGVVDPNHVANNFDHDCAVCHTTGAWLPVEFDHNMTVFSLTGAHVAVACASCHATGYAGTPSDCFACHETDYIGVIDPNHVTNNFDPDCRFCHTTAAWLPVDFNHNQTAFPLTGAHTAVNCAGCHSAGYTGTLSDCIACHETDYIAVIDPIHLTNNFDLNCLTCHNMNAWIPSDFDHNQTLFPLSGAHTLVNCIDCHGVGYTGTPTVCFACHETDFNAVIDPSHVTNNFDHDCLACHNLNAWIPSDFNHNQTMFALEGAHLAVACIDCHTTGYTGTPTDCFACHEGDYNAALNPSHVVNAFGHNCTVCHNMTAFVPADYNHNYTAFPLTGAHAAVNCIDCHSAGYAGTPSDCFACHEADYNGVVDPNHVLNGFGHNCTVCHTTNAFVPASYDHSQALFPLTGAHAAVACIDCHATGYDGTPTDCFACHEDDYIAVVDPSHVTNNFDHDCSGCHSTNAWLPSSFDHNQTLFPLAGAHAAVVCVDCHGAGYAGTPTDCFACHEADYNSVVDPNHVLNNFGHNCAVCHNMNAFFPAVYDHNLTAFPLTGAHTAVNCIDCHSAGYAGTPTACFACHGTDYAGVVDPNHVQSNFNQDCVPCHTTAAWLPANFDHNLARFPLTGAHLAVACNQCHANGYTGTPMECVACHESDYLATTNPNHAAANFPTLCETCHTTNGWTPANWDHDGQYFPIYAGKHKEKWNTCADCHNVPTDYTHFECILCHKHRKTPTDDQHKDVSGYVYQSTACLNCHPDGRT